MAKRKKRYTKKNNYKSRKTNDNNLKIIITIILSVLLAVLLYTNSGVAGQKLNEIFGGLIGVLRYFLPIGLFAIAIKIAVVKEEEDYITKKILQYLILIICISIVLSVHQISAGAIQTNGEMSQTMKKAYTLGASNQGGGAIGTLAAVSLVKMLGSGGAIALSIGISVMLFIFVCGIDVSNIIGTIVEKHLERKELKDAEKEQRRKEREAYLAQRRKERLAELQERNTQNYEKAPDEKRRAPQIMPEQIEINLNGRRIENEKQPSTVRKLKGLLTKNKEEKNQEGVAQTASSLVQVDEETGEILEENSNLFVQEEEQKQDKTKQVLQLEHTMAVEEENYVFPPVDILSEIEKTSLKGGTMALKNTAAQLQKTLYSFGVSAKVENVTVGPAITRYELKPAEGVRVSKIANLADDIALNLAAETIRIEAPIPGKQAVGIEVPNKEKEMVGLREVIESEEFKNNKSKLSVALGKDVARTTCYSKHSKNATRTYCRKYRIRKICMYKYNNYKHNI